MTEEIKTEDLMIPVPDELMFKTKSGKEIRLKMYYKQLLRLTQYANDNPVEFQSYLINDNVHAMFIDLITSQFDDKGNIIIPPEIEEFKEEMTVDQAIEIATWCGEHVNNFFMRKLHNQEILMKKHEKQYQARVNLLQQLGLMQKPIDKEESSNPSTNG